MFEANKMGLYCKIELEIIKIIIMHSSIKTLYVILETILETTPHVSHWAGWPLV